MKLLLQPLPRLMKPLPQILSRLIGYLIHTPLMSKRYPHQSRLPQPPLTQWLLGPRRVFLSLNILQTWLGYLNTLFIMHFFLLMNPKGSSQLRSTLIGWWQCMKKLKPFAQIILRNLYHVLLVLTLLDLSGCSELNFTMMVRLIVIKIAWLLKVSLRYMRLITLTPLVIS